MGSSRRGGPSNGGPSRAGPSRPDHTRFNHDAAAANRDLADTNKELIKQNTKLSQELEAERVENGEKDEQIAEIQARNHREIARLRARKNEEIAALNAKIERGIISYGRDWDERPEVNGRQTTWQNDIRRGGDTVNSRIEAFRKACTAANVSQMVVHPCLVLKPGRITNARCRRLRTAVPVIPFRFMDLPFNVMAMIFKKWLVKSSMIHAISRPDRWGLVRINPRAPDGFCRKFHWGRSRCSIANAKEPNEELRLLLVSKSFYHMGVSCFYSQNIFAFSSLGETGRFLNGIGPARRQRVRKISITFIGALQPAMLSKKHHSVRQEPLHVFPQLRSLTHVDIYLDESGAGRERRKYEDAPTKAILRMATTYQMNQRQLRSLRTIQGMDYLYQLRGVKEINVFDYGPEGGVSADVLDSHFVEDLRAQVYLPKTQRDGVKAKWDNLTPLLQTWHIPPKVRQVIKTFFVPKSGSSPRRNLHTQDPKPKSKLKSEVSDTKVVIDLTGGDEDEDEVVLQSIEDDIGEISRGRSVISSMSHESVKDENDEVVVFSKSSSREDDEYDNSMVGGPMFVTPGVPDHNSPSPNAETRYRLLKRKMKSTRPGGKRPRVQGTDPLHER